MAETKTLKEVKMASGKKNAPFHDFTVKVKVVKVGHTAKFTSSSTGEEMSILNFSVADATDCIMATLNEGKRFRLIADGKSLHLRNFVLKNNKLILTKMSKIMICAPVNVPAGISQQAVFLVIPHSPQKKIAEIRDMPNKSVVTVIGKIIKDECIRKVKVGGEDTDIHTIRLQDEGQQINVSLWREMSRMPLLVGQYVEVTQCVTGEWQGQAQLNSTRNTTITHVQTPEVCLTGTVEGLSLDDKNMDLAIQTADGVYEDLVVGRDLFLAALPTLDFEDDEGLEEALINMLPFSVTITTKGGNITSMIYEDVADRPD